jgi:hypothetical protein
MRLTFVSGTQRDSRVNYVAEFMFQTLGYKFNIVSDKDEINADSVILSYIDGSDAEQLTKLPLIHIFYSKQLYALDDFEKKIDLFDWHGTSIPILGDQLTPPKNRPWKLHGEDRYYSSKSNESWYVGFDIITNIFFHLSRYEEKWRHFAEETATDYSTSILSRYQQLKVPVVDVLLEYIDRMIIEKVKATNRSLIKILNWPAGEDFGVALTHDVDLTRGVGYKERLVNKGLGVIQTITGEGKKRREKEEEMEKRDALYWSYPQMISFYKEKNWRSTFFFLTRMFEGLHIRYNISSRKFKKLLGELNDNGHEIALHSSLKAFDKRGWYREEKERLEKIISSKCFGVRQHYLRAKFPRLWKLADHAGFSYDSSLSYNFQAGFRAGTSHPFETFEYDEDRKLAVLEFSLLCFENNLPIEDNAIEIIAELIKQVARFHGTFVALLHPSNFLNEPHRNVWDDMIQRIESYNIYVDTLNGHYRWHQGRAKLSLTYSDRKLTFKNPASVNQFSAQIIGGPKLKTVDEAEYEQKADDVLTIRPKRKQISIDFA